MRVNTVKLRVCMCVCLFISHSAHWVTMTTTNELNAVQKNILRYVVYRCHNRYSITQTGIHENFGPKSLSYIQIQGHAVAQFVEALHYKPED